MIELVEISQPGLDRLDHRDGSTSSVIELVEIMQPGLEAGSPGLDRLDHRHGIDRLDHRERYTKGPARMRRALRHDLTAGIANRESAILGDARLMIPLPAFAYESMGVS